MLDFLKWGISYMGAILPCILTRNFYLVTTVQWETLV